MYLHVTTVVRGRTFTELATKALAELDAFFAGVPYVITNQSAEAARENYNDAVGVPAYIVNVTARSVNEVG